MIHTLAKVAANQFPLLSIIIPHAAQFTIIIVTICFYSLSLLHVPVVMNPIWALVPIHLATLLSGVMLLSALPTRCSKAHLGRTRLDVNSHAACASVWMHRRKVPTAMRTHRGLLTTPCTSNNEVRFAMVSVHHCIPLLLCCHCLDALFLIICHRS